VLPSSVGSEPRNLLDVDYWCGSAGLPRRSGTDVSCLKELGDQFGALGAGPRSVFQLVDVGDLLGVDPVDEAGTLHADLHEPIFGRCLLELLEHVLIRNPGDGERGALGGGRSRALVPCGCLLCRLRVLAGQDGGFRSCSLTRPSRAGPRGSPRPPQLARPVLPMVMPGRLLLQRSTA
jgi:hypothetical protein